MLAEAQITALGVNDDLCSLPVRMRWKPAVSEVNSWKKALSFLLLLYMSKQRERERGNETRERKREYVKEKKKKGGFKFFFEKNFLIVSSKLMAVWTKNSGGNILALATDNSNYS